MWGLGISSSTADVGLGVHRQSPFGIDYNPDGMFYGNNLSNFEARANKHSEGGFIMGDSYTISISANLINQLAGDGEKPKKKTKKVKAKAPSQTHKVSPESNGSTKSTASIGWPQQHPLFAPISPLPQPSVNAELEAIRSVVQESEKAVERLQKKEAEMIQELTDRAKELHEKEFKLPYQKPTPCLAEKKSCLECYKEHAKDPLRCAPVVKAFSDCARRARQQMTS
ncbi:hypothetical protein Taro_051282 [Colocasia esculenta]|uniref:Uncharacterized protein n=1 Tax=Colocasia esculenta TaxID=4460 RepID=A0A843XFK0_COLES|nr:hypothetical protein [Colocasia esculenta]